MLTNLFYILKAHGVPVSIREHLDLLTALKANLVLMDTEEFYYLARVLLVKDEKHFDKFDKGFQAFMNGAESLEGLVDALIPDDWLRSEFIKHLTDEEKAKIKSLGSLDELIKQFKQRMEEQKARHAGGNKWVGTGGTSPFGHSGYHPAGIRIGGPGRNKSAVKVWDKREFKNLDDSTELSSRNLKVALRRLRKFARDGAAEKLDLEGTIRSTANNAGLLDIKMEQERHNAVKVLIFFDVGGSMDDYVHLCESLFSAARSEFKHLEFYYFHNFIYETVWKDNNRRHNERISMLDILNTYSKDYKVIFVGDASMSPWEINYRGGSIEHHNQESGAEWMQRLKKCFEKIVWINPIEPAQWQYTHSIGMVHELMEGQMYPLTAKGLEEAMTELSR